MRGTSTNFESSQQRCSIKKGVVRNFTKFTGKHLCLSLFFIKAAGLRPATLLKKRLWHGCFPVNFAKFSKHLFSKKPLDNRFCKFIKYKTLINQKPRFQMQAANLTNESAEVKIEAVVLFIIPCGTSKDFLWKIFV